MRKIVYTSLIIITWLAIDEHFDAILYDVYVSQGHKANAALLCITLHG